MIKTHNGVEVSLSAGYYWAMLHTPVGKPEGEDWASSQWEICAVEDNNGPENSAEQFSVQFFGISVTQWPAGVEFGERVAARDAASVVYITHDGQIYRTQEAARAYCKDREWRLGLMGFEVRKLL